jgi:PPOX class probable F420-dependent enzyme
MSPELRALGRRRYVSLTTFRRTGVGVPTAVWIAAAGDALVVTTGAAAGKTKRIRNDPRVELRECDVRGRVRPGAPVVGAHAEVVEDPDEQHRLLEGHRRKYGWQFRVFTAFERLIAARAVSPGSVVLRITDA